MKNWPTPRTTDIRSGRTLNQKGQRQDKSGQTWGANLSDVIENGLSPADSPARISARQVRERESGEVGAVFGLKCLGLFAEYDPSTSLLRMLERSLFEGWTPYSEALPKQGMMRNGKLYEQRTWVLRTDESESGLLPILQTEDRWPTPKSAQIEESIETIKEREKRIGKASLNLSAVVNYRQKKWPTPHANASTGAGRQGRQGGLNLQTAVEVETLDEYYERTGEMHGSLNPTWVDWLMGYPIGWTDLEDSEMQLSLK